jgi:hypothetical protein
MVEIVAANANDFTDGQMKRTAIQITVLIDHDAFPALMSFHMKTG